MCWSGKVVGGAGGESGVGAGGGFRMVRAWHTHDTYSRISTGMGGTWRRRPSRPPVPAVASGPRLLRRRRGSRRADRGDPSRRVDASNELVWALLELAVDDELAVRAVLQAVVPGLGGELGWLLEWARRTDPGLLDEGDVDQMLVVAAMEAIRHAAGKRKAWPLSVDPAAHARRVAPRRADEDRWRAQHDRDGLPVGAATTSRASRRRGSVLAEVLSDASRDGTLVRATSSWCG